MCLSICVPRPPIFRASSVQELSSWPSRALKSVGATLLREGREEEVWGLKGLLSWVVPPPLCQVAGELKYHPECFICLTCGTFIGDGDTYTLVEHSKLYW